MVRARGCVQAACRVRCRRADPQHARRDIRSYGGDASRAVRACGRGGEVRRSQAAQREQGVGPHRHSHRSRVPSIDFTPCLSSCSRCTCSSLVPPRGPIRIHTSALSSSGTLRPLRPTPESTRSGSSARHSSRVSTSRMRNIVVPYGVPSGRLVVHMCCGGISPRIVQSRRKLSRPSLSKPAPAMMSRATSASSRGVRASGSAQRVPVRLRKIVCRWCDCAACDKPPPARSVAVR